MRSFSLLFTFLIFFAGCITFGAASPGADDFESASHLRIDHALKGSETVRVVRTLQQAPLNRALQDLFSGQRGDVNPAALEVADRCRQFPAGPCARIGEPHVASIAHAIASPRAPPHDLLPAA